MRRLALWLAVLPFMLLSLVLPGTMLVRDAQGGVTVVLCAGDGPVEMRVAPDGSLVPVEKPPHADAHVCDWAPHARVAALGAGLEAPPVPVTLLSAGLRPAAAAHLRHADPLAPVARGPPRLI